MTMQNQCSLCCELVRQLGSLDAHFSKEYSDDLAQAEEYPHGIMSLFATHLCRQYEKSGDKCDLLLTSALSMVEDGLGKNYETIQNIVEVSFIETIFYNSDGLFRWMLDHSGPLLRYEELAFLAKELGYRVINAIRKIFDSAPPGPLSLMMKNQEFQECLHALGISVVNGKPIDPWGQPIWVEPRLLSEGNRMLWYIRSLASLRGHGKDIEVIG